MATGWTEITQTRDTDESTHSKAAVRQWVTVIGYTSTIVADGDKYPGDTGPAARKVTKIGVKTDWDAKGRDLVTAQYTSPKPYAG